MALETEVRAFEAQREELERHYKGDFVIFHGEECIPAFDSLDAAAQEAVRRFGRGPYLIRQVGVPAPQTHWRWTGEVEIGFNPKLSGTSPRAGSAPLAAIPSVRVQALIDTGAQQSCIDEQLAQELHLPLIDQALLSGVSGATIFNVYLAHIIIPGVVLQYGQFTGVQLQSVDQDHRVLICGALLRDVLLVYDGRSGSVKVAR
jgi:predicted aspartyl protease